MATVSSLPIALVVAGQEVPAGRVEVDVKAAQLSPAARDGSLRLSATPRLVLDPAFVAWVNAQATGEEGPAQ